MLLGGRLKVLPMVGLVSTAFLCKWVLWVLWVSPANLGVAVLRELPLLLLRPWRRLTEFEQGDFGEKVFAGGASAARLRQLCLAVEECRNISPSAAAMSIAMSLMLLPFMVSPLCTVIIVHLALWVSLFCSESRPSCISKTLCL